MNTLPSIVPAYPDETIISLAIRHAKANEYPSTAWINDLVRTQLGHLSHEKTAVADLAPFLALDEGDLQHRAHLASEAGTGLVNFWGAAVLADHIDRTPMRVCPQCLREETYLKALWELTLCRVCPRHSCLLIEVCPSNGHPLDPNWPELGICRTCKIDYKDHDSGERFPITAEFWRHVQSRIDGREVETNPTWMPELQACALPELLDLVASLQAIRFPGPKTSTMSRALQAFNRDRSPRFVEDQEVALSLLTDWPHRFDDFCEKTLRVPSRQTELTERAVDQLHSLMTWSLSIGTGVLRERVRSHVTGNRRSLFKSFLGSSYQAGEEDRYLLLHEVDAVLGIKEAATRELFQSTALDPGPRSGSTRKRLVVTEAVPVHDVLKDVVDNGGVCRPELEYLTFQEAGLALRALGAKRRALLNGLRCGDIEFFFEPGRQPHLGTARISYESFLAFFQESLNLDLQQWIPLRLAALLAVLDPETMVLLRTKKRIQMRGEAGVPESRTVLLHSLLEFKKRSRILARIGGVHGASRQRLAAAATTAGVRAICGLESEGSTIVIRRKDVAAVLSALAGEPAKETDQFCEEVSSSVLDSCGSS